VQPSIRARFFSSESNDTYTSPGFSSAENRIELDLSQAIGSVRIEQR